MVEGGACCCSHLVPDGGRRLLILRGGGGMSDEDQDMEGGGGDGGGNIEVLPDFMQVLAKEDEVRARQAPSSAPHVQARACAACPDIQTTPAPWRLAEGR